MNETFDTRFGIVDVRQVKKASPGSAAMDLVNLNGLQIGIVTKFRNTKTDKHPWTAFLGVGDGQKLIGHYYSDRNVAVMAIILAYADRHIKG